MQSKPLTLKILDIASVLALAIATYLALIYAPEEAVMGQVQTRVLFPHWNSLDRLVRFSLRGGIGHYLSCQAGFEMGYRRSRRS